MIGKRLKDLREARGYTQQELGEAVGRDKQLISRIERGGRGGTPTVEVVTKLAAYLEVSTDFILGLVDEPKAHLQPAALSGEEQQLLDLLRSGALRKALQLVLTMSGEAGNGNGG